MLTTTVIAFFAAQSADVDRALARCSVVEGKLDRLTCFEEIAKNRDVDGPKTTELSSGEGKWVVEESKNPIDDSLTITAVLAADTGQSRYGEPVTMIVRCKSNEIETYINWNSYLGDDADSVYSSGKYVTTRIRDEKAVTTMWSISTDREATFDPGWSSALLEEIIKSNSFVAQTTPYGENPITAEFDTTGSRTAFEPLARVCGWSLDS